VTADDGGMVWLRRVLVAIGSFVAGWLCLAVGGWFVPQILGPATTIVLAFVLGGLIYRDIMRREGRGGSAP
jgi:zinc transporter ZupT